MIKAIAIDDEPPALDVIENFCSKIDFIDLQKTFTKPTEALKYLRKFPVDLLFLDIQMPSLTGIEFYKAVQQDTKVIFTTAHSEYAVEGFNLQAVDFLLKPYTFERFEQAVNRAKEAIGMTRQSDSSSEQFLFVRADYSLVKINISDILYIEGLDDYLKIHVYNQKTIVTRMTMKSILKRLPQKDFVRIHRSFIIPFKRVESVKNKVLILEGKELPIGNSYEEEFFKLFKQ
ncbi:MAG: LytTR family DNA-binding domain-containing protein [Bacteroidota bacterium]|nr:LytTR family DNA-binding domain-containing protein [Bacteroidota bacterium]